MITAFTNGCVLGADGLSSDVTVHMQDERIAAVTRPGESAPSPDRVIDLEGDYLLPGYIDTQVNGGGGVLFNDDPSVESIRAIGAAHRRFGTTGFLPTLISDDLDKVEQAIAAVRDAIRLRIPGVLGVHLEGPFLNVARKGVHDAGKFRQLDDDAVRLLSSLKTGRTVVTLAPELASPSLIRQLADHGVRVAAGHTNATYAEIRSAIDHGLSGFTHLFNAMSPLASREPGVVGAALEDQTCWCGLIVDGRHVDPVVLKIALRCRPLNRFMLVTDAMPTVGCADKTFNLQGRPITVKSGVCVDEDGVLAGSDLDMSNAVINAMHLMDLSLSDAVQMASGSPAAFLGLSGELGHIAPGYRASVVRVDREMQVVDSWIDGRSSSEA